MATLTRHLCFRTLAVRLLGWAAFAGTITTLAARSGGEPLSTSLADRPAIASLVAWPGEARTPSAAAELITGEALRRHAAALADDTFEGRATGTRGGRAAAGYLQTQFKAFGLKPAGDQGGYFQTFDGSSRNILGMIEGSDEALRDEVILVSAHYDHVGYGNARNSFGPTGHIHNGADDNASGAATLCEVAEAMSKLDPKPKRSVLFALWDAEESGLNGSKYWLSRPTVKLSNVRIMINMDMVGRLRNNKLTVYGARTARGLRRFVSLPNRDEPLAIDFSWEIRSDSDHHPFYTRGIPILMLHTGLHSDYHRPSDDVDKLNIDGMRRVARLLFEVTASLANEPELPKFREAVRRESTWSQQTIERLEPPTPGRLGLAWDRDDRSAAGLKVIRVVPGAAADQAGVRVNDRLVSFAGIELPPGADLAGLVLASENPVKAVVARPGAEQPIDLTIQLRGQPTKLGILWREDEAEPGSVKLVGVLPGSPADRARLRPLDRIYAVNGQPFADGKQLREMMAQTQMPYEVLVESGGKTRTATIEALKLESAVPAVAPPVGAPQ